MPSVLKPRRWLAKATFTSPDLSGGTNGGLLSPDQFKEFIRVATDEAVILKEARQEFSNATKFEVPRLSFHGVRILTNGVEATRLADADRKKPVTGMVTLSTNLFRGEVPVSDEIFEDSVEQAGIGDTIMEGLGRAVGRDIEDFAIKSDTARIAGDNEGWLDSFDGLIKTAQTELGATQEITMTGISDPETVMRKMLEGMPYRYRGDPSQMRLFVPVKLSDAWTDQLSARGTPLEVRDPGRREAPRVPRDPRRPHAAPLGHRDHQLGRAGLHEVRDPHEPQEHHRRLAPPAPGRALPRPA